MTPDLNGKGSHACDRPVAQAWKADAISANELRRMAFVPVRYILPDFIPEGVTILASEPKVGKSWLALDLCIAVAAGRSRLIAETGERGCPVSRP